MPRNPRRKIVGKREHFEQRRRDDEVRELKRDLDREWRDKQDEASEAGDFDAADDDATDD